MHWVLQPVFTLRGENMMKNRIYFRVFIATLTVVLGGFIATSAAASPEANPAAIAAVTYVVNDATPDCGLLTATHTDIQTAVNDAINDNVKTIFVCPGPYGIFTVTGANKLTIKAAVAGDRPVVNATLAATSGMIIDIEDSAGVVLDGLVVDGTNFNDALTAATYGIYIHNASATVQNVSVTKVRCFPNTCNNGFAIYALDDNGD